MGVGTARAEAVAKQEAVRAETAAKLEELRGQVKAMDVDGVPVKAPERKALLRELKQTEKANLRAIRAKTFHESSWREFKAAAPVSFEGLSLSSTVIDYRGESQEVSGVQVIVETAGQLDRRLSLSRVAAGGFLFGPAGAVIGGLAKKRVDRRELYLVVDGPLYAWVVPVSPKLAVEARRFAAAVNTAAKG